VEHRERGGDAVSSASQPASGQRDAVNLTPTANRLKRIEMSLADVPDVDQARVAEIRQQIQSGSYQINAQRLADKLLTLDRDLA